MMEAQAGAQIHAAMGCDGVIRTLAVISVRDDCDLADPHVWIRVLAEVIVGLCLDSSWAQPQDLEHWMRTFLGCAVGLPTTLSAYPKTPSVFTMPCLTQAAGAPQGALAAAEVSGAVWSKGQKVLLLRNQSIAAACPGDREWLQPLFHFLLLFMTPSILCSTSEESTFPVSLSHTHCGAMEVPSE